MSKFFVFILMTISCQSLLAARVDPVGPPVPSSPPPPPGLPVDGSLMLLLLIALILGYYLSNKYITIKKESL